MPEGSAVCNHVIDSATDKDPINELSHLHCKEWLGDACRVADSMEWEKGKDDSRNIGRLKDIGHGDVMRSSMDKLSSGAITVDEETSSIVVVYGGAKAAGQWVERV